MAESPSFIVHVLVLGSERSEMEDGEAEYRTKLNTYKTYKGHQPLKKWPQTPGNSSDIKFQRILTHCDGTVGNPGALVCWASFVHQRAQESSSPVGRGRLVQAPVLTGAALLEPPANYWRGPSAHLAVGPVLPRTRPGPRAPLPDVGFVGSRDSRNKETLASPPIALGERPKHSARERGEGKKTKRGERTKKLTPELSPAALFDGPPKTFPE